MTVQVVQIGEIAILLLVAYAIGWAIGYRAHRLARHPSKPEASARRVPAPAAGTIIGASSGAVPVTASAAGSIEISATIPEPLGLAAVPADVQGSVAPAAASALETLKSLSTAMPLLRTLQPAAGEAGQEPRPDRGHASAIGSETAAEVLTDTLAPARAGHVYQVAPDPMPVPPAMPATAPGLAWSGTIAGREAEPFAPGTAADGRGGGAPRAHPGGSITAAPKLDIALEPKRFAERAGDLSRLDLTALELAPTAARPAGRRDELNGDESAEGRVLPDASDAISAFAATPSTKSLQGSASAIDEDSAMRDIEGGWSRRGAWAAVDMTEVSAAVNAAQVAVEQVLARDGVEADAAPDREQTTFGKPHGLPHPRDSGRDDLKQIAGLGPMDESALNNLGIYHFDQIANLNDREVLWLENHAFARGRIGRESWRQQARSLIAETAVLRMER